MQQWATQTEPEKMISKYSEQEQVTQRTFVQSSVFPVRALSLGKGRAVMQDLGEQPTLPTARPPPPALAPWCSHFGLIGRPSQPCSQEPIAWTRSSGTARAWTGAKLVTQALTEKVLTHRERAGPGLLAARSASAPAGLWESLLCASRCVFGHTRLCVCVRGHVRVCALALGVLGTRGDA